MGVFILFLLFMVGIPSIMLYYTIRKGRVTKDKPPPTSKFLSPNVRDKSFLSGVMLGMRFSVYLIFALLIIPLAGWLFGDAASYFAGVVAAIIGMVASMPWNFLASAYSKEAFWGVVVIGIFLNGLILGVLVGLLNLYRARVRRNN